MTRSCRPVLWLLLAAALFMRAVLPQGYMPERTDGGSFAVVVCGSGGTHLIRLGGAADQPQERQRAEPPCAFAGLGTGTVPPSEWAAPLAPAALPIAFAEASTAFAPAAPHRLLPPARGPPLAA